MRKKCVASIMNKCILDDNKFIFYCDHATVGEMDEETYCFIDEQGKEYLPMLNASSITDNLQTYHNAVDLEKMQNIPGISVAFSDVLREFEKICKETVYYVGQDENGMIYCANLNDKEVYDAACRYMDEKSLKQGEQNFAEEEERYADHYTIGLELEQLLVEIMNGKYTAEELDKILNLLEISMDEIYNIVIEIDDQFTKGYVSKKAEKNQSYEEKETEKKEGSNDKIDIEELYQKVTKTLIAQDEPAKRVITEIARKEMDTRKKKEGILLTGPTGIGKTELMRLIAKYINRPFFKVDSTQLTIPGYVGKDIEEVLWDLYEKCDNNLEETENAIIFFDEIDKKGSSKKSDVSGQGVLNLLLPFIEGSTYDATPNTKFETEKVRISTDNMIVILGGAYSDVYNNVPRKNDFGFLKEENEKKQEPSITTKDFVERGLMTNEFMSRVTVIKLNDLDVDAIKRVMLESDESAIKIQQEIFEKLGVKLTFTDGYTTEVAKNAFEKKTGARGLNSVIDESTWKAFEKAYSTPDTYEEIILDENTLENPENFQYVLKRKENNIK